MKYIKTYEQFVNESIDEAKQTKEEKAAEKLAQFKAEHEKDLAVIDELDDDIEEETESRIGAKAKLQKVFAGMPSGINQEMVKLSGDAYEKAQKAWDKAKAENDKDTKIAYEAEGNMMELYSDIYISIAKAQTSGVIFKMKKLLSFLNSNRAALSGE